MFKKSLVPKTIPVNLLFLIEQVDEDTGEIYEDEARVTHYFRRPTPATREALADKLTGRARGRKVLAMTYDFWRNHIVSVEGYDELKGVDKGASEWNNYFRDEIGMEHVQSAVITLLSKLGGRETDMVKESDSSLEESSEKEQTSQSTRTKKTT